MNTRVRRALGAVAVTCAMVVSTAVAGARPSAAAETIQSDQARADQLAGLIQAESARISTLANAYDAAQLRAKALSARLQAAQVATDLARRRMDQARRALTADAVIAYVQGGTSPGLVALLQHSLSSSAIGSAYVRSAASSQQDSIDRLTLARQQYQATTADLAGALGAANANAGRIRTTAAAATAASAGQQRTLVTVKGRLADLVAQARAREAAARQAAAQRAEAARLARAQQAAAQLVAAQLVATHDAAARSAALVAARATTAMRSATSAADASPVSSGPTASYASSSPSSSPSPSSVDPAAAVRFAEGQVGKPYQWGGAGPDSYDCSGLVMRAWEAGGVSLDHYTGSQYAATSRESAGELRAGDLVFWQFPGEAWPGHVGLYIGGGQVVVADTTGTPVRTESMYYDGDPVGFGRVS